MKEKEYLYSKVNEVFYNEDRFTLFIGNGKYIYGITGENLDSVYGKIINYKTIYDTLVDIDFKIKYSFDQAIKLAYSKAVKENYSIIHNKSNEEKMAYYFIENALFRTSTLWDMLAQLYRLKYKLNIKSNNVYYNKIFSSNCPFWNLYSNKATEISEYIIEEDNIDVEGEWKGNHKFVNDCRNKMTHRNSPNISVISDYDINFKHHPSFMLKRVIEDYNVASKYINDILKDIELELMEEY